MSTGAKRILMLTHEFPPFRGGIGRYASELATAAQKAGHDIVVLAPDFHQDMSAQDETSYPFKIIRYRAGAYGPCELVSTLYRTFKWSNPKEYDIIHAVDPSYAMALAFAGKFKRLRWVSTVYGTDILGLRSSAQASILGVRSMFERPHRLFAVSQFTRTLLKHHCPAIPDERIQVTPLGVDPFWFGSGPLDNVIRQELALPADKKLVLTVARLDSRKGHRGVLKALAQLEPELRDQLAYVIAGSGSNRPYVRELKSLASASGTEVHLCSGLSDEHIRALYRTSSVFCMPGEPDPQKVEGFGLVYLEAAAQGLPSIGADLGAVPEVVKHEHTGLIVPPLDVRELANALRCLLTNDTLRFRMGAAARIDAARYSWHNCARLTYGDAA